MIASNSLNTKNSTYSLVDISLRYFEAVQTCNNKYSLFVNRKFIYALYGLLLTNLSFIEVYKARKKNFGSGQLMFENWSGGPVEVFFFLEPQPIFSKSYFSTSHKTRDPDSTCINISVMAQK